MVEADEVLGGAERRIGELVTGVMNEDGIPGLGLAVVDGRDTLLARGFGARDLATNAPVTPETLFGLGSVTKSFTALAIARLADRGNLSVEDPVSNYVPLDVDEEITVHHLLSHTSGLPSNGLANVLLGRLTGTREYGVPLASREEFYAHVNDAARADRTPPGEEFFYYASGFVVLGDVIEAVTGEPYAEHVEALLADAGMERTTFGASAFESATDAMTPYLLGDDGPEERPYPTHELVTATGGLFAPVAELAEYLKLQSNGGRVGETTVLGETAVERMHRPHVRAGGRFGAYGYGMMRSSFGDDTLIGHGGDAVVSSAYVGFLEDRSLGVALVANASPGYSLEHLGRGVLAVLTGGDPHEDVPFFRWRRHRDRLTGTYESFRGIKRVTVHRDGSGLRMEVDGIASSAELSLVPATDGPTPTRFHATSATGDRQSVRFVFDDEGTTLHYDRWILRRDGPT